MLASSYTSVANGIDASKVTVEVDISRGLRVFSIVGLPTSSVNESRTRVKSALENSGYGFPKGRVTVNLAPGHLPKAGTGFDLPIALAILAAQKRVSVEALSEILAVSELSLDGTLRPVAGILTLALNAKRLGFSSLICHADNSKTACQVEELTCYGATHLTDVVNHLLDDVPLPHQVNDSIERAQNTAPDLQDVKGQARAIRALEISAAGAHNLLMSGPPGCGKSMLAKRLPGLLSSMTKQQRLEVAAIHSSNTAIHNPSILSYQRPFRAPHHTISDAALIGGGVNIRPGEVSLAHHGVLFLDELLEFRRTTLECLRQPLQDGQVLIARSKMIARYPSRFVLVAAMNPCPCGYSGHPTRLCTCTMDTIVRYQRRLSGPLADRFDLHLQLQPVDHSTLLSKGGGTPTKLSRSRVDAAITRQKSRSPNATNWQNGHLSDAHIQDICSLDASKRDFLEEAANAFSLSNRGLFKSLKVARTIADLDGSEHIKKTHLCEALSYRRC
ncbi:MAG: YifB family Mg chelatase-like AAA ATPase [Myxococcota bacterium]|nr:YifB family Mg chelatase-like AAA ATPase [Myxococcota bacterium]